MSLVHVVAIEGKPSILNYLDKSTFKVLNSIGFSNTSSPLLAVVVCSFNTKYDSEDITPYFRKSKLNPNGFKKVKAFNFYTKNKLPILNKIAELELSSYVNPIIYNYYQHNGSIANIINHLDKIPNDLIIKDALGATQSNICFVNKEVFIDTLHLLEMYILESNAPDDTFDFLKPIWKNGFHRFMFGSTMYVEEDLTDRIVSEYRILYGYHGDIMVCERKGYGRQDGEKSSTHIVNINTFEDFFNHIHYDNSKHIKKFLKNIKSFIEWMDAPIISLDILVLDNNEFTIIESSNEFAFKNFDPVYSKEFINKAYISYCKCYGLIK